MKLYEAIQWQFAPIADRKEEIKNVGDAGSASGEARSTYDLLPSIVLGVLGVLGIVYGLLTTSIVYLVHLVYLFL
jgi:hypothetical protein